MPQYRVKQNFGRWGQHFKLGEVVEIEKALASEVRKSLEPVGQPKPPAPAKKGKLENRN